ncbi:MULTISPECIES: hydrogenase maturation nickel metallochaperone HypA [unclassified Desulfovibrio]|uniref:hydrogenase maturation nickel metallochaperone HypA/HybF n=1 Tax=unclassified Desulfovibrio TaxID=2593640 RepID=UPI000F5EDFD1|nr:MULTISPECIES: hydrogenase maturation nickel metallochaperone HypA [unclassified Desulfovibrio]RRD72159.1 hydrogenase maturation nickel metallochaperone HypA [Desulfovibrio sp. OH1209_COT-279]RRD88314.1 hydrogenase maturation nickel metallochaperone HypA [Desulfovibrio sp. OH1186_COT-070]
MHEATLAQSLLGMALKAVREHNAARPHAPAIRIREIRCELGLLACVEAQALSACFELLAEGTEAEGARLVLRTAPLDCSCRDCGYRFALTRRHFACSACGGENIHFTGGHGLTLLALEVASEENHD